jgi:hypothetical protein
MWNYISVLWYFSQIFLINFNDKVDNIKPITGTKELKKILL